MGSEKFSTSGLYWLCKEAENRSSAADPPPSELPPPEFPNSQVAGGVPVPQPAPPSAGEKRRRGRPRKAAVVAASTPEIPQVTGGVPEASPPAAGVKRRRGRPSKAAVMEVAVAELSLSKLPDFQVDRGVVVMEAAYPVAGEKRRRGRPAKTAAMEVEEPVKRREKEDEDVCFICFDGGSLVLCDRGDCPKAYHPACIKRDEAFFQSNAMWTCGWHICSKCQKSSARYMCYTCTYSLCKGCSNDADYLRVRGNKGFCSTCYRVVMMIEKIGDGINETIQVDFDDKLSWEYLFKVYWICLKTDLSLTADEIIRAQKLCTAPSKVSHREKASAVYFPGNNGTATRENSTLSNKAIFNSSIKPVCDNNNNTSAATRSWASKELLDFVTYMRNGDTSVLSQREVQALLFDYIKKNSLRDPHQRSEIICDSKLENLFKKPRVRHFEMLSLLEFHFLIKDDSWKFEFQAGISNPVVTQVTGESNSDNIPMIIENSRHKVDNKDEKIVDINVGSEEKDSCEKLESHVDSSGSNNNNIISESLRGVKPETPVASLSTGSTPSANHKEAESSWCYRDPTGKIQGPFVIEQLNKWSFPPDMKIWRLNTEESDSVLLAEVIKGHIPSRNNISISPEEAKDISDSTSHHCDGPCSGSANSDEIDRNARSNIEIEFSKCNEPVPCSSNLAIPVIINDSQINNEANIENSLKNSEPDPDLHSNDKLESANDNATVPQSSNWATPDINNNNQNDNAAKIENSSKSWDRDTNPHEVIDSYSNQTQVHSVELLSKFTEKKNETPIHENNRNVGQPQSSAPNYENGSSEENMVSHANDIRCSENQISGQRYLGRPSADEPISQNSLVNNWNNNKFNSQCASIANPTDSSEQRFSIDLRDFPMTTPKTSCGNLQAQTIRPMANPTYASEQKLNIVLQDFPMPRRKNSPQELQSHTIKEQQWNPLQVSVRNSNIKNVLNLTSKSTDHDEREYSRNKKMETPTNNYEKIQITENKLFFSPNFPILNSGGGHLSKQTTKPSIDEWDSCFLSVSSLKPHEVVNNHVAPSISKGDEFPPLSPPNPVPNASSWLAMVTEPIEFNTLAEESVSDLLAEVDAMESNSDLASPNPLMDYADDLFNDSKNDLFHDSKNNCFSSLRGLSSSLDRANNDDVILPPQSSMREEPMLPHNINTPDPLKKSRKNSLTVPEIEIKRFDNSASQFEFRSNRPNLSPPKKTRDLADIMNGPKKHGNLNSPGSTRRESGQGTPRESGTKNRSTRESHKKHGGERLASPREHNITSPRDRNSLGGDSGSKGRLPWSRQSSGSGGGGGGHSRTLPRGQRVCKFFENGYCRKGAFCDYLHP